MSKAIDQRPRADAVTAGPGATGKPTAVGYTLRRVADAVRVAELLHAKAQPATGCKARRGARAHARMRRRLLAVKRTAGISPQVRPANGADHGPSRPTAVTTRRADHGPVDRL